MRENAVKLIPGKARATNRILTFIRVIDSLYWSSSRVEFNASIRRSFSIISCFRNCRCKSSIAFGSSRSSIRSNLEGEKTRIKPGKKREKNREKNQEKNWEKTGKKTEKKIGKKTGKKLGKKLGKNREKKREKKREKNWDFFQGFKYYVIWRLREYVYRKTYAGLEVDILRPAEDVWSMLLWRLLRDAVREAMGELGTDVVDKSGSGWFLRSSPSPGLFFVLPRNLLRDARIYV